MDSSLKMLPKQEEIENYEENFASESRQFRLKRRRRPNRRNRIRKSKNRLIDLSAAESDSSVYPSFAIAHPLSSR